MLIVDHTGGCVTVNINECLGNKGCREDQYCVNRHCGYSCPACTAIANCERLICTTASNHQCNRCNFDRGGQVKAYQQVSSGGYPNRVCEQRCSWRPDSNFCYPGRCPTTPSSCTCAPGFGGNNCLTISSQSTIMHCLAKLQRVVNYTERDTLEADCGAVTAPSTVYVGRHNAYNRLQVTWDSSWIGPTAADWPRHQRLQIDVQKLDL
ncbi:protein kinase C-binding protein NELL2-like [Branchiostoma floridae]|uniref:Protein kinase C-binding protein NELL2-like n=1 Tax=Branchiostoma floridae TaxID=7739 RepID=A0A9J7NCE3_BRAFL|nr:protein kinase C-binding protein NELL2-like [Branchiostoma floridae]